MNEGLKKFECGAVEIKNKIIAVIITTSAEEARKDNNCSFDLNWWQETPDNLYVSKGNETDLDGEIIPAKYPSTYCPHDLSKCE
ncbi:unnamed protein product [Bursaphelenchus xylophilus]|uniref:(pine wood nematode) hypothetical protein n=1 Tax=Bursaphelenchus xylophilus TaxID=6326 RepID=A0A1I7SEZ6_BURXY|nr:unnamed protein product [Bursaphelenchus xylophilus]CAG9088761.1 unnamed protein product [Bursaphelenchus xylophilus]